MIVVDENIPYGREAFETLGAVRTMPGRAITRSELMGAEVLCVRSVTKVDAALLEGTGVRCVVTATIGYDHVDLKYLESKKIAFASAPGSNANSVSEYITAALLVLAGRLDKSLKGMTLGVVGVGNVGSRVVRKAEALGMTVLRNDPPLARQTGDPKYRPLSEVLSKADVVTVHVPLSKTGPDATYHLIDAGFLARLKPGAILLNSSRGSVHDSGALLDCARSGRLAGLVLDVFEGEPSISPEILSAASLGTPHIAGYSFDGKVAGTVMIYEAVCRHLGATPSWDPTPLLPAPEVPEIDLRGVEAARTQDVLAYCVKKVYDIEQDDADLRHLLALAPREQAAWFDRLRKEYRRRREFQHTRVLHAPGCEAGAALGGLGFQVGTGPRNKASSHV